MDYDEAKVPYKLYEPDAEYSLDHDLEEISGLSVVSEGELAAIEDENGILYLLNAKNGKVIRKIKFAKDGDYEALEVVHGRAYIAKSNGDIYSFDISGEDEIEADEVDTEFSSHNDIEGMTALGAKLLISCKGQGELDDNDVEGKAVYIYNPETKSLEDHAFNYKEKDLEDLIAGRKFFNKIHHFDPSAIAIHPITSDVYWLSADKILVVLTDDYKLKEIIKLDGRKFRQPEGICFSKDGTLYISSEGNGGDGKIFKFNSKTY